MNKYYPDADKVHAEDLHGYAPPASPRNLESIRARFDRQISQPTTSIRNRRHTLRRIGLAAASLCVLLTISITALAMSGILDLRGFYDSIFNNETAAGSVLTGDAVSGSVTDNGIEIQPMGAYIEDNQAYLRVKVTDLEGGRLSELLSIRETDSIFAGATVESYTQNTAIVILSASTFGKDANGKISLDFGAIYSGVTTIPEQALGITVNDVVNLDQPLILPGLEFMEILGAEITGDRINITRQPTDPERYGYGIGELGLKAPDGTVMWSGFGLIGPDGLHTDQFMLNALDPAFTPGDYALVIKGERPERVINGDWTVSFDNLQTVTPRTLTGQTADGQTISISCGATRTTVKLTPGYAYGSAEYDHFLDTVLPPNSDNPALTLTLKDGTVITPTSNSVAQPGVYAGDNQFEIPFSSPFVLPQEIKFVTWMGETFTF